MHPQKLFLVPVTQGTTKVREIASVECGTVELKFFQYECLRQGVGSLVQCLVDGKQVYGEATTVPSCRIEILFRFVVNSIKPNIFSGSRNEVQKSQLLYTFISLFPFP